MIDCHAHAFPTLGDSLARVAPRAAEVARDVRDRVKGRLESIPFARGLVERVTATLETSFVDVEKMADLRRRHQAAKDLEPLLALVALPQVAASSSIAKLYASMVKNGIEKTVLIAGEPVASNEWVLAQARDSDGRLVPVVNVPAMRDDATDAQWDDALSELAHAGARGFKIHLNMDGLGAEHRAYRRVFEVADREGLFVIVHTGCFHVPTVYKRHEPAEPALFAPLIADHPDVHVCLAHMNRDEPEKAWELMKRYGNVWTDTSWQPREAIERAVREVGTDRILLGSDWPLLHADLQGDVVRVLHDAVDEATAETIGVTNARAFLGD